MEISKELETQIKKVFKGNDYIIEKLLNGDVEEFKNLAIDNTIDPLQVINAFESGKKKDLKDLYKLALFKQQKKELYFKYIEDYSISQQNKYNEKSCNSKSIS